MNAEIICIFIVFGGMNVRVLFKTKICIGEIVNCYKLLFKIHTKWFTENV